MLKKTSEPPCEEATSYLRAQVLTWPNFFTAIRLVCAILLFARPEHHQLVFWDALVGALTDIVDGWLARTFNLGTDFGKTFDQWVDWCFGFGLIYAIFIAGGLVFYAWPFNGELIVLIGGYLVARLRYPIAETTATAKWKTAIQFSGAVCILGGHGHILSDYDATALTLGYLLLWISLGLMFFSGWEYLKQGARSER